MKHSHLFLVTFSIACASVVACSVADGSDEEGTVPSSSVPDDAPAFDPIGAPAGSNGPPETDVPAEVGGSPGSDGTDMPDDAVPPPSVEVPDVDPDCTRGIKNGGGTVCCSLGCGSCGGTGCESRPGAAAHCCAGPIMASGVFCDGSAAPCILPGGEVSPDPPAVEPPSPKPPSYGTLVLEQHFARRTGAFTNYTYPLASEDFPGWEARSSGEIRGFDGNGVNWPADNRVGSGVLRASFPANIAGGTNSGFLFDMRVPNASEATLEYRVLFEGAGADNEFVWAAGGKLPGLGGSSKDRGIPVGCTKDRSNIENGFSARLMWRRRGELVVYTYRPDRTSNCGVDISFLKSAQPNQWYTLRQYVKLNTPGQRNGILEMFVDGTRALRKTDVLYRLSGKDDVLINDVLFHAYRGGEATDTRFHSPHDDHIRFDDFRVWVR